MRHWIIALALVLLPSTGQAEWLEASSANFVVYADDSERDARLFSERLELYHEALEVMTGLDLPAPSPSNRLTVFVVSNQREVQRLYGEGGRNVGGFYMPRAAGSLAIVPRIEQRAGRFDPSMLPLLHEYAHHFLISNSNVTAPRWYSEGGAEFFASADFPTAGGIKLGMPARHRAGELLYARQVSVAQLLDPATYTQGASTGFDSFYGKSWLLYHYLALGPEERRAQGRRYLALFASGKTSPEAGIEAFGDLAQLDRELEGYLREKILTAVFAPGQLQVPAIAVRRLTRGEAAIMPIMIRSRRGVTRQEAIEILAEARAVAARYPDEAAVQAALAEAEFDAGNDAEAIAAADAALALDPNRVNAYVQKGYALFRRAASADDKAAAYKEAIAPFLALNKLENDHPLPLVYYFRSFVESGRPPPAEAVRGLERAAELAPFDLDLRINLASHQLGTGELSAARFNLVPIAYNPHGGNVADAAREVIEWIDACGATELPELLALLGLRPAPAEAGGTQ